MRSLTCVTPIGRPAQHWATFVRNHAHVVLACDFFTTITVRFRLLYVFVVLDVGTRRIVHWNVTAHPTADWTIQQCRAVITGETAHRFLVHDRDAIYAPAVDDAIRSMGLRVLQESFNDVEVVSLSHHPPCKSVCLPRNRDASTACVVEAIRGRHT